MQKHYKDFKEFSQEALHKNAEISDENRFRLIPKLLKKLKNKEISFEESYFLLHKSYFEKTPFLAQLVYDDFGDEFIDEEIREYARKKALDPHFYDHNIGQYRKNNPKVDNINFPSAKKLPEIGKTFFNFLDLISFDAFEEDWQFFEFLMCVDVFLRLTHLPFDGSGRTNEDFLVLISQYFDRNLTFSLHGYRGLFDNHFIKRRDEIRTWLKTDVKSSQDNFETATQKVLAIFATQEYGKIREMFESYSERSIKLFQNASLFRYLPLSDEIRKKAKEVLDSRS